MNGIAERQNEPESLRLLASQRVLYFRAKRMFALSFALSIVSVGWSLGTVAHPSLAAVAGLWGILSALLDVLLLEPRQKVLSHLGAQVQEQFDCHVLGLDCRLLKTGWPAPELVVETSLDYERRHGSFSDLRNWYSVESTVPIDAARVICQRSNAAWDYRLRRTYASVVGVGGGLLGVAMVSLGVIAGYALDAFVLAVAAPALPVALLVVRQWRENREAAVSGERLVDAADALLDRARDDDTQTLSSSARDLQDELFERRRSSPPVFDVIYRRLRDSHEVQMREANRMLSKKF